MMNSWLPEDLRSALEMVDRGDPCALVFLIAILTCVGAKMVGSRLDLRSWGTRIASGAFVAYCVYGQISFHPGTAEDWIHITLRGLLAAGLVLGFSWINLAVSAFVNQHVIAPTVAKFRIEPHTGHTEPIDQRALQIEQDRRTQEEIRRREHEREETRSKAQSQRRRTDARAAAALSFSLYAPKLGNRFTKEMFDKYVTDFMGDQHAPEDVERHGQELVSILEKHLQEIQPPKETRSVQDLARWYQEQKDDIESLPVDARTKRTHLVNLNERYTELTAKLLENMGP